MFNAARTNHLCHLEEKTEQRKRVTTLPSSINAKMSNEMTHLTFRTERRISRRVPTGSLLVKVRRAVEFVSNVAQYCSSCKSEIWTGTQYSTNLEDSGLLQGAVTFVTLFIFPRWSLKSDSRPPVLSRPILHSSNVSRLRYSDEVIC